MIEFFSVSILKKKNYYRILEVIIGVEHIGCVLPFLPCDAMHSATIAGMRCLSVRPSVTFVSRAKTNKDIFEIFQPCGSQAILVFPYRTGWRYSIINPP